MEDKPVLVISKCLGFGNCRFNGHTINDEFVKKLSRYVSVITICPEVEIGLGVPRHPLRIVESHGKETLFQPASGKDFGAQMDAFSHKFLDSLQEVDGFVLKWLSPSCGLKEVRVYPPGEKVAAKGKTKGFFGRKVMEKFPGLAIEDEGRLHNMRIREHFLTKLFMHGRFRKAAKAGGMRGLVDFHSKNKFLLMAYGQKHLNVLGRIVANAGKKGEAEAFESYTKALFKGMNASPKTGAQINVLVHIYGYFSEKLNKDEKMFFNESLEAYRSGRVPLSAVLGVLRSWAIRFGEEYIKQQTYFQPYPQDLMESADKDEWRDI